MAEAIPAQGVHERETYISTSNELMMIASERHMETTKELKDISILPLQRSLNSVYSPREDSVDNIVSQNGLKFLGEQKRSTIQSYLKEVSEACENIEASGTTRSTSTTVSYKIPGVDQKLACTQHRFKIVTPVRSTIYAQDFGLTWCPRIDNPFLSLRRAARNAYDDAYNEFKQQYYVPKPIRPDIVWETFIASTDVKMQKDEDFWDWSGNSAESSFTIYLSTTENYERSDLNNAKATWTQNEGF